MSASHAIFAACILQEVKDELGDAAGSCRQLVGNRNLGQEALWLVSDYSS